MLVVNIHLLLNQLGDHLDTGTGKNGGSCAISAVLACFCITEVHNVHQETGKKESVWIPAVANSGRKVLTEDT